MGVPLFWETTILVVTAHGSWLFGVPLPVEGIAKPQGQDFQAQAQAQKEPQTDGAAAVCSMSQASATPARFWKPAPRSVYAAPVIGRLRQKAGIALREMTISTLTLSHVYLPSLNYMYRNEATRPKPQLSPPVHTP